MVYPVEDIKRIHVLMPGEWFDVISSVPNIPIETPNSYTWLEPDSPGRFVPVLTGKGELRYIAPTNVYLFGIRPKIYIPLLLDNIGSKVRVGSTPCTVIDREHVLTDIPISSTRSKKSFWEYVNSVTFINQLR